MKTETTLPLPADEYTERLVLGSLLLDPQQMDSMRATLEPDDFSTGQNRDIWGSCCAVYDTGAQVETCTVFQSLRETGRHGAGLSYLGELIDGVPLGPLDRHIQILKDKTKRRRLMTLADNVFQRCAAGLDTTDEIHDDLLTRAQDLGMQAADKAPVSTREIVDRIGIDELLAPSKRKSGLRLPWARLETALSGLRGGQLIVVAAYTSRGKSSLACQISSHATKQETGVFYWSTEMSPEALFRRMVDQMSGADGMRHRAGQLTFEEIDRAREAVGWLYDHPIWFDRTSRTVTSCLAALRHVQQKHKIGLVVVDHLQHVKGTLGRGSNRAQEVSDISRSLKMAALDFDLPFLVVSQVSRPKEENSNLTIHMIKESGDVENDADVVMLLNSPKQSALNPVSVALNIAKQREGPAGFDIPLLFRPSNQSFEALED